MLFCLRVVCVSYFILSFVSNRRLQERSVVDVKHFIVGRKRTTESNWRDGSPFGFWSKSEAAGRECESGKRRGGTRIVALLSARNVMFLCFVSSPGLRKNNGLGKGEGRDDGSGDKLRNLWSLVGSTRGLFV